MVEGKDLLLKFTLQQPIPSPSSSANMEKKKGVLFITVIGHVDHGKKSLLDKVPKTIVASGEIYRITETFAAFSVRDVVPFIDTLVHASFSGMQRYGDVSTDVIVLVVTVEDCVMPQMEESVSIARTVNVLKVLGI